MKERDVLIAARPDQSLQIYDALTHQDKLKYNYITFKVVPNWVRKLIKHKKLRGVGCNSVIEYWGTFKHLAIRKYRFRFANRWTDCNILVRKLRTILSKNHYKIIHFWPEHCSGEFIGRYKSEHPDVFIMADIHMPHPEVVLKEVTPIYNKFGVDVQHSDLCRLRKEQKDYVKDVDNIIVPSNYVADTYKELYPNKKYYVVPYGIKMSETYEKSYKNEIRSFVYIGGVSLEKGCDLLLDLFLKHPELQLHIYGSFVNGQEHIFKRYVDVPNIIFHGFVPKAEIQQRIKECDAGIHLSRFDAYSLAVGEVIGTGKPVIVSDKTGNKEDVEKYGLGIVSALNISDIEQSLKMIQDSIYYNKCVDNIDSYLQKKESSYGSNMIDFYNKLIENTI